MLNYRIILLIALLAFCPAEAQAGWTKVFDDEFGGTALNPGNWFTRYIYSGEKLDKLNDEKEVYRENNNHVFKDGHLELTAYAKPDGTYESGMIRSKPAFYYGYFEARLKLPSGKGVFPAFWLNSDYDADGKLTWPPEIDVFELVNNGKDDTVFKAHLATDADSPDDQITYTCPEFNRNWSQYVSSTDLTKDWHTWGLMWLPDSIAIYLDGVKLYAKSYKWVTKGGLLGAPAHILLNLAIGGQWAGRYGIDDNAFPQAVGVAYVRVYQYRSGEPGGITELPNVPDFASYRYDAPGDLLKPTVYPVKTPARVRAGQPFDVSYRIGSVPAKHPMRLRLSLTDASGEHAYTQTFELPGDLQGAAQTIERQVRVTPPASLAQGSYGVDLALAYCPSEMCSSATYVNVPLTPAKGAVREANLWYRVGQIQIDPLFSTE